MGYLSTKHFSKLWKKALRLFVKKEEGKGLSANDFDAEAKKKLDGIEAGAEKNIIKGIKGNSGNTLAIDSDGNVGITEENLGIDFVKKEEGKGLSTNDFDTESKTKLDGIEAGAEKNVIKGIKGSDGNVLAIDISGKITITKDDVGLDKVNNTPDSEKSVAYANAAYAAEHVPWSGVTEKPTTLSGYGITDAPTKTGSGASGTWGINVTGSSGSCSGNAKTASSCTGNAKTATNVAWSGVTGKPTSLGGYGITDAPTKTGAGASGTWGINISGNAATASTAALLGKGGAASGGMKFFWKGQGGQPTWLWGGNDPGTDMYVYNPSNFSVNYAKSAGSAGSCTGNAASATKATNDSSNRNIVNTYYAKAGDVMTGGITMRMTGVANKAAKLSSTQYMGIPFCASDGNGTANRLGLLECSVDTNGQTAMILSAYTFASGSKARGSIAVYNNNGTVAATAPTPATADNSTKIATTAWVINFLKSKKLIS